MIAAVLAAAMPVGAEAQVDRSLEDTKPWLVCLAETARSFAASPDDADTVAAAVITSCNSFEEGVRVAQERSAARDLVREGVVADEAEAWRVLSSIGNKGWDVYMAHMGAQVTALVVEDRATARRPEAQTTK